MLGITPANMTLQICWLALVSTLLLTTGHCQLHAPAQTRLLGGLAATLQMLVTIMVVVVQDCLVMVWFRCALLVPVLGRASFLPTRLLLDLEKLAALLQTVGFKLAQPINLQQLMR